MENTKIAASLLKIQAVKFRPDPPFVWSSGWRSPIYCDNRQALSFPALRGEIADAFAAEIRQQWPEAGGIAGVATGAIAWGALVAERLGLPFLYIRSQAKGHGLQNLVEGALDPALAYVVVEDLVSTGGSSLQAVRALRAAGGQVAGLISIFTYGFPQAAEAFAAEGLEPRSLTNLEALLQMAEEFAYLRPEQKELVRQWQLDPEHWEGSLR